MAQKFESVRRPELVDTVVVHSAVQPVTVRANPERAAIDALLSDAEASQRELTKRIPGMIALQQVVPTFDWHSVTGVDHQDHARYCHQTRRWL